jgi:hypothetical protein
MAEVEDFIDFLNYKDHEQPLTQAALVTAEPSFRKIWDNPEDADYDHFIGVRENHEANCACTRAREVGRWR